MYLKSYPRDFEVASAILPDICNGEADWGDYDKDGDLNGYGSGIYLINIKIDKHYMIRKVIME